MKQLLSNTEGGAIANVADMGETIRWYHFGDHKIQFESELRRILMSRPFLEMANSPLCSEQCDLKVLFSRIPERKTPLDNKLVSAAWHLLRPTRAIRV